MKKSMWCGIAVLALGCGNSTGGQGGMGGSSSSQAQSTAQVSGTGGFMGPNLCLGGQPCLPCFGAMPCPPDAGTDGGP